MERSRALRPRPLSPGGCLPRRFSRTPTRGRGSPRSPLQIAEGSLTLPQASDRSAGHCSAAQAELPMEFKVQPGSLSRLPCFSQKCQAGAAVSPPWAVCAGTRAARALKGNLSAEAPWATRPSAQADSPPSPRRKTQLPQPGRLEGDHSRYSHCRRLCSTCENWSLKFTLSEPVSSAVWLLEGFYFY